MKVKRWKAALLAGSLALSAVVVADTPLPGKASIFYHEFRKTSKSGARVSVWERVVYSLMEANNQAG